MLWGLDGGSGLGFTVALRALWSESKMWGLVEDLGV